MKIIGRMFTDLFRSSHHRKYVDQAQPTTTTKNSQERTIIVYSLVILKYALMCMSERMCACV